MTERDAEHLKQVNAKTKLVRACKKVEEEKQEEVKELTRKDLTRIGELTEDQRSFMSNEDYEADITEFTIYGFELLGKVANMDNIYVFYRQVTDPELVKVHILEVMHDVHLKQAEKDQIEAYIQKRQRELRIEAYTNNGIMIGAKVKKSARKKKVAFFQPGVDVFHGSLYPEEVNSTLPQGPNEMNLFNSNFHGKLDQTFEDCLWTSANQFWDCKVIVSRDQIIDSLHKANVNS